MVDSHFANTSSHKPLPSQRIALPGWLQFTLGAAVGLVIGAFCGAFLPDRVLGAGSASFGDGLRMPRVAGIDPATTLHQAGRDDARQTSPNPAGSIAGAAEPAEQH